MANSSNALWIGGIVIVAALTAVELLSSRDNDDTIEAIDSGTVAGAVPPASPQQDAGQIAMGATDTAGTPGADNKSEFTEMYKPDPEYDASSEYASDLIVDLDNPEANIATATDQLKNLQDEVESSAAKMAGTLNQLDESLLAEEAPAQPAGDEFADIRPLSDADDEEHEMQSTASHHAISQHLAAAEEAIKALRMTTPAGDNAYEHYQAVLAIDPNNAKAHAGIEKMVDIYVYFVEKAIAEDELNNARVYLQRAENIKPGSSKLKSLRAELN
ncbi:hypothetical protein [Nitrosomonas aestuarii]|uniref:hypothetical protein n=1 Tax=Nitrosomonas aestuarii TaxID=52441 RepID=UPI000D30E446|nr:hypothetical protein [Nitrosomonas aestuarii]PTN12411.1 hypothetical protein C8R11_104196 [Nitrosomonas aestuarii]